MRTRRISTLVGSIAAVLVVGLIAAVLIGSRAGGGGAPGTGETGAQHFARVGGTQIVVQVTTCDSPAYYPPPLAKCDPSAQIASFIQVEQQRVSTLLGVNDAVVTNPSDDLVQIDLPGVTGETFPSGITTNQALLDLSITGAFDVVDTGSDHIPVGTDISQRLCPVGYPCPSNAYLIYFTEDQLDRSTISASTEGAPIVTFAFAGAARDQFAAYTNQHIGQYLTLTLDGIVIESATIQSEITGTAEITGLANSLDATHLAGILKAGALPLSATVLSLTEFGPGNSCVTPVPGTPLVYPGTATPAPNATYTPEPGGTPTETATPAPSGQAANFAPVYNAPVYSGGPGLSGTPQPCETPTATATPGGPTPTPLPSTPYPSATVAPGGTATPKP